MNEIENAQTPSQVHVKTFKAGEVFPMTLESGNFRFPMFEGALKQQGRVPKPSFRRAKPASEVAPSPKDLEEEGDDEEEQETETAPGDREQEAAADPDFWRISGDFVYRYHNTPRKCMFVPVEGDCPVPLRFLDVDRYTSTNIDGIESTIRDY